MTVMTEAERHAVVCMEPGEERDAGILYPGRGH